jgi:hypothetical protein
MAVRGEKPWPYAGRNRGRTRGYLMAAYGEKPMAIDMRPRAIADRRVTRLLAPLSEPPNGCVTGVPVCGMLVVRTGPLVSTCAPWNV